MGNGSKGEIERVRKMRRSGQSKEKNGMRIKGKQMKVMKVGRNEKFESEEMMGTQRKLEKTQR